jgi:(p)ppGpp synthase/HD superfamily hydrolase
VQRALALASRLHAADHRQREPYLNHPLRVAIRVVSHYRVADPDLACVALLHDAVEDHAGELAPGGGQPEALAALAAQFGDRVAGVVAAVTNPAWQPGGTPMTSTASKSPPACRPIPRPGSSRSPTSSTTAWA